MAEVAGQATHETGHPGAQRHLEAFLVFGDEGQRVALVALDHLVVGHHLDVAAARPDEGARGQADEGIAPEALAAHHGLQQAAHGAAPGPALGQFQVEPERGVQIGIGFGHQRDAVVSLGGQGLEFDFGHACLVSRGMLRFRRRPCPKRTSKHAPTVRQDSGGEIRIGIC